MARIRLVPWETPPPSPIASKVTMTMCDSSVRSSVVADFRGTPDNPLNEEELRDKFLLLTRDHDASALTALLGRLRRLEEETTLDWISV